jgi:transketolase
MAYSKEEIVALKNMGNRLRAQVLRMSHEAKTSHVGSSFSIADLVAVLYSKIMRLDPAMPDWPLRDRFILSKGHACAVVYSVLAEKGFFPKTWLDTYKDNGSPLPKHISHCVPGVEASTGSLGHGLAIGSGMALAGKRDNLDYRVFVILSDGECDEGSTWEAALFAPHHKLSNVVAIVDYNKLQAFGRTKDVLDLDPMAAKWQAFGWSVREIDGHDVEQILDALSQAPLIKDKPTCIIAHTVKGKGVGFMEDQLIWHYRNPSKEELQQGLEELGVPRS